MKVSAKSELSMIRTIRERFPRVSRDVVVGIGDDSAVVAPRGENLLLTSDAMVERVHFDRRLTTPYQLGFKIVSVNVSDIYAMAGTPRFMLLCLAADDETGTEFIESFFDGMREALKTYRVDLVGGDLSSSPRGIVVSATVVGYAGRPVLRSGARPGDRIYVTGNLGDSGCGFELLKRIRRAVSIETGEAIGRPLKWRTMEPLLRRHLLPLARSPRGLSSVATSMIDISDGLFLDLTRLCDESRVGARVFLNEAPLSPEMKMAASALGLDPYRLATSSGEDYELLFTAPPKRKVKAFCIGEITQSERVVVGIDGRERPLEGKGYTHWR